MENTKHRVTKKWLNEHKTPKGGWTKKQIQALGLSYPPVAGWMSALNGELIDCDKARQFEDGKTVFAPIKIMKLKKVKASLATFSREQLLNIEQYIKHLLTN